VEADRWLGLEVRHLMALRAVVEEGTFARAAVRLGYTQSAISQQIAALERIVGGRLLERPRGRRTVGPTPTGALLLRHADAIVARVKAAQADVEAVAEGAAGVLRVGTYQSVGMRILPTVLPAFAKSWPHVEVELRESASDHDLLGLVERAELDLTFSMLPVEEGPFESRELVRDRYRLVVAASSPVATSTTKPSLREIAALPLLGFRSCRNEHLVDAHLRAQGLEPNVVFRSDDNGTLQALVAAGMGAALMPGLAVDLDDPETVAIDLGEMVPPRHLGIVWHRDRVLAPAAAAFVETAVRLCGTLEDPAVPAAATAAASA
jgi:DNA-binding transcriptional LysR family regulator